MQIILPTDKRNPSFSLYFCEGTESIHVFYGLELLEVVPFDREHAAYKLLVARLYNAGLRVQTLTEIFGVDPKTMRGWGRALQAREPALLAQMLLGADAGRKLTAVIKSYVRHRWPQLMGEGCRNYRQTLQEEIARIFDTRLSGETLRQLIADIRAESSAGAGEPVTGPGFEPCGEEASGAPPLKEAVPEGSAVRGAVGDEVNAGPCGQVVGGASIGESTCSRQALGRDALPTPAVALSPCNDEEMAAVMAGEPAPASSKSIPCSWSPRPSSADLCDHAGLLLFAGLLGSFSQAVEPPEPLLSQWLASVLLGARNVEQTKYLNWESLSLLLGSVVRFPTTQREGLARLATPATVDGVLRWNLQQLGPNGAGTDLYLDPHTQHYTGMQSVLKGWCAALRWADKLLNSDYVHTAQGHPIYFECGDNFEDLRARFAPLIERLRATLQWEPTRVLTFVVDRGIYSNEVFAQVLADPHVHLITWQKGYVAGPWEAAAVTGTYGLEKVRNNARDVRLYQFAYIDRKSATHEGLRQIVVLATNPKGKTAQLAILTDDFTRPAESILGLMFKRWIQENDFKYLDKHFGINQITSYRSLSYESLREGLTDRLVPDHAYVQKAKAGKLLLQQKSRLLATADQARRDEEARQARLLELQNPPVCPPREGVCDKTQEAPCAQQVSPASTVGQKELSTLRSASKRFEKYRLEREQKIESLHLQLVRNQLEKDAMQKEVSRIDQLVTQEMVRLDTRNKTLMDAIKITARNLFYQVFAPFKTAYNNYRDDHDYFRELTQSGGVLRWRGEEIEVHLVPHVNYAPKLRQIIGDLLQTLNEKGQTLPDGSGRKLRLRLTARERIEVRVLDALED